MCYLFYKRRATHNVMCISYLQRDHIQARDTSLMHSDVLHKVITCPGTTRVVEHRPKNCLQQHRLPDDSPLSLPRISHHPPFIRFAV